MRNPPIAGDATVRLAGDRRRRGRPYTDRMKALVLAAGRGERMRPLTDRVPKPLLAVRGKRLIEWHLEALARAGVRDVVVNTAWLEEQFPQVLGDGERFGLRLRYSMEGRDHGGALETAGGIAKALDLLEVSRDEPFWVVGGDVYVPGFPFDAASARRFAEIPELLAHLWLVPNAPHHPRGDFAVDGQGRASAEGEDRLTWSSVGLVRAGLVDGVVPGTKRPLRPCLDAAIAVRRVSAELWSGHWTDVGTPERLAAIDAGGPTSRHAGR
jgi:MurNAc alpha-1-phosphate uridylyltransferase